MDETQLRDRHGRWQHVVEKAAAEERVARSALQQGWTPSESGWSREKQASYDKRFDRWRRASRALVEALDALAAENNGG